MSERHVSTINKLMKFSVSLSFHVVLVSPKAHCALLAEPPGHMLKKGAFNTRVYFHFSSRMHFKNLASLQINFINAKFFNLVVIVLIPKNVPV